MTFRGIIGRPITVVALLSALPADMALLTRLLYSTAITSMRSDYSAH